ncbi:MAG: hypothetical protein ACR5LD_04870 [Symbiopectobacterium sp.]
MYWVVYGRGERIEVGLGPSVLLAYIVAGIFVFFIMRSMGEMLYMEPVTGSFAVYAHKYMSPFFWLSHRVGLLVYMDGGWDFRNHCHRRLRAILVPGTAAADPRPAIVCVALVAIANLVAVRLYCEIEF